MGRRGYKILRKGVFVALIVSLDAEYLEMLLSEMFTDHEITIKAVYIDDNGKEIEVE